MSSTPPLDPTPQTVFVVDDDQAMRESLEFLLGTVGLEVRSFASAADFLASYDPAQPGCLLTDVRMPGIGGFALHEELDRRGIGLPVIMMTAYADVPMAVRAMQAGAIDFIEKPFNDQDLLDRLQTALRQDRDQRARGRSVGAKHMSPSTPQTPETRADWAATPFQRPQRLLQYNLLGKLGAGGMGEVFLAEDSELHRQVAIKFLHLHNEDTSNRLRFRREAQAAAGLNHPNIVTIHQILEEGEYLCIVMEYIEGQSLRSLINGRSIGVDQALDIALQMCNALAAAHAQGIVHRDVKPENVLLASRGPVKLLDFGLAVHDQSPRITEGGRMLGTPAYMSPEQALGEDATPHSDQFALGIILYELLVGDHPFPAKNSLQTLKSIMGDPPQPFPKGEDAPPEALGAVVLRTLDKDPNARFPDIEALAHELARLRATTTPTTTEWSQGHGALGPATLTPTTPVDVQAAAEYLDPTEALAPKAHHARPMVILMAVLSLGLAGLLGWFLAEGTRTPLGDSNLQGRPGLATPPSIAVLPFTIRGADELEYLDQGLVELLSLELDGAGALSSVDPRALLTLYNQSSGEKPSGEEVAQHFEARYFTQGSLVNAGTELLLAVTLYDVERPKHSVARATARGSADDIFRMLDTVATQLLASLSAGPEDALQRTAMATSHSLPAIKAYMRGEELFQAGQYQEALMAFQNAVAKDPDFALAYYRLCVVADWVARDDVSALAAAEAERLQGRLSNHHRALLGALIAWRRGDAAKAERISRSILGTYAMDIEAWFRLGEVQFHYGPRQGRPAAEAREAFERVLEIDPDHIPALWHLTRLTSEEGSRSVELASRILELQPIGDRELEVQAMQAFASGDSAARAQLLESLDQARDLTLLITLWNVATFAVENEDGRAFYRNALAISEVVSGPERSTEMRGFGHVVRAYLHLAVGREEEAFTALDQAAGFDPVAAAVHRAHLLLNPMLSPSVAEFEAMRDRLEELDGEPTMNASPNVFLSAHNGLQGALHAYLVGRLGVELGDTDGVQRQLEVLRDMASMDSGNETRAQEHRDLIGDLRLGLRAHGAVAGVLPDPGPGAVIEDLKTVQATSVWYGWTTVSPFFSRSAERFLLAELLAEHGQVDQALRLYGSFTEHSLFDLVYDTPAQARRELLLRAQL